MKTKHYTLTFLLSTGFLFSACTDTLTGANQTEGLENIASSSAGQHNADLSLKLDLETDGYDRDGSPLYSATTYIHNDGPDDATGVQLVLTASTSCHVERSGGDEIGGDIILVDIVGSTGVSTGNSSGGDDDDEPGGDIILVDLLGAVPSGASAEVEVIYSSNGAVCLDLSVEVMRSDLADPDSTPGNGYPDEDDQAIARL